MHTDKCVQATVRTADGPRPQPCRTLQRVGTFQPLSPCRALLALPNELWALKPDTGELRWFADTGLPGNIAPSVVLGDGVAFAFGGFPRTGAVAVKLGGKGDVTTSNVVWTSNLSTFVPTPVLHEGRLYFASDAGFATCLDAKTGTLVFRERLPGAAASGRGGKPFYASAVLANRHVYAQSRRNGVFVFALPEKGR